MYYWPAFGVCWVVGKVVVSVHPTWQSTWFPARLQGASLIPMWLFARTWTQPPCTWLETRVAIMRLPLSPIWNTAPGSALRMSFLTLTRLLPDTELSPLLEVGLRGCVKACQPCMWDFRGESAWRVGWVVLD